jgi:hypothetical protein
MADGGKKRVAGTADRHCHSETSGAIHAPKPRHPGDQGFIEAGFASNGRRDRETPMETLSVDENGQACAESVAAMTGHDAVDR